MIWSKCSKLKIKHQIYEIFQKQYLKRFFKRITLRKHTDVSKQSKQYKYDYTIESVNCLIKATDSDLLFSSTGNKIDGIILYASYERKCFTNLYLFYIHLETLI